MAWLTRNPALSTCSAMTPEKVITTASFRQCIPEMHSVRRASIHSTPVGLPAFIRLDDQGADRVKLNPSI